MLLNSKLHIDRREIVVHDFQEVTSEIQEISNDQAVTSMVSIDQTSRK